MDRKTAYYATTLFYPKEYFANNFQQICMYGTPFNKNDKEERNRRVKEFVGGEINDQNFRNLASYCSADQLRGSEDDLEITTSESGQEIREPLESNTNKTENELRNNYLKLETVPHTGLQTLKMLQNRIKLDPQHRFSLTLKHRSVRTTAQEKTFKPVGPTDLIPGKDLLYRIRVYRPFVATKIQQPLNPLFAHDVIVHGSQTLDVLRDSIQCGNEKSIRIEISEHPDTEMPYTGKDIFKSGFIFVEDTFYNDHRNLNNIDYSECIRKWASKRNMPKYKTAKMEEVTFNDLKFRVGHPQVYQHLGNCEHLLIFSDVRLLKPTDVCHSSFYPHHSIVAPSQINYCMSCRQFSAKWIVIDSDRNMFNPALYCNVCFKSYNYINGKKIGNFQAYQFSSVSNE